MSIQVLPFALKYEKKNTAAVSRSTTSNLQPQGSLDGYGGNSVCTINIPTGHNMVLSPAESVLKFNIARNDATAIARWDSCGAHGLIQRIRVYHGSNLLEDLDSYNLFAKEMFDLQVSNDSVSGKYSILAGTRPDLYSAGTTQDTINKNMNTGALISNNAAGNEYCITLLSLLGSLSGAKYFPLFACTSAPIRLEITFVNNLYSCACTTATNTGFKVNRIEYIASMMELSDSAIGSIISNTNGGLVYTTVGVRNYQDTMYLSTGNTQKNFNIPARFSSVKSIIVSMRDSNQMNNSTFYPFGTYKYGLSQYNFKIGSTIIPAKAPNTVPNFFYELIKCVNNVSNINHQPAIDLESYSVDSATPSSAPAITAGSAQSGSFYIGLNTETFPNSDNTSFYTGLNTSTDDIACMLSNTVSSATNIRLDAYVSFDQELHFENGVAFVSF